MYSAPRHHVGTLYAIAAVLARALVCLVVRRLGLPVIVW
jgi:hypothetical protein